MIAPFDIRIFVGIGGERLFEGYEWKVSLSRGSALTESDSDLWHWGIIGYVLYVDGTSIEWMLICWVLYESFL